MHARENLRNWKSLRSVHLIRNPSYCLRMKISRNINWSRKMNLCNPAIRPERYLKAPFIKIVKKSTSMLLKNLPRSLVNWLSELDILCCWKYFLFCENYFLSQYLSISVLTLSGSPHFDQSIWVQNSTGLVLHPPWPAGKKRFWQSFAETSNKTFISSQQYFKTYISILL